MPSEREAATLHRAASRAARGPAPLLATLLASWRQAFPADDPKNAIGVPETGLDELALCRRPRSDRWVEDVEDIASTVGADAGRLIAFLRMAEAVETFAAAGDPQVADQPRLLAARDDEEGED